MNYDTLVVGAGLYGCVYAHEAAARGKRVLVIDRRDHIGGNCYTEDVRGIHVHRYGAHIFHTSDKEVWDYVRQFSAFNHYINAPVAIYKDELYNLPFNMNTFAQMWGVKTPTEARAKIEEQRREAAELIAKQRAISLPLEGVESPGETRREHFDAPGASATCEVPPQGADEVSSDEVSSDELSLTPRNLEEQGLLLAGRDIFDKLIRGYTEKQWGRPCSELPAFIIKRLPFRFVFDNNYFNDPYQGIPEDGYTKLCERLLEGIDVRLNTSFVKGEVTAAQTVYTGRIDQFFDFTLGALDYRSLRFETEDLPETDNYQGNAVVNYTERDVPYTRVIEHKHFRFGKGEGTVITREYPDDYEEGKEPYYPLNDEKNNALYARYVDLAKETAPDVLFGGRLGRYQYYNMDQVIRTALDDAGKL